MNRIGGLGDDDDEPCTPLIDALFPYHYVTNSHQKTLRDQCPAVVSMLLRAGADVRMATADGQTPLHMAAIWGLWYIIPMLLAAGAEVDAIMHISLGEPIRGPKLPETPLDSALRSLHGQTSGRNRNRVFRMLIRAGARIPTQFDRARAPYVDKVARAGGYAQYEKAHRTRLAACSRRASDHAVAANRRAWRAWRFPASWVRAPVRLQARCSRRATHRMRSSTSSRASRLWNTSPQTHSSGRAC